MSRILWFHPRPWGPPRGGGDLRTQGLVACAMRAGHEIAVVVPSGATAAGPSGPTVLELAGPRGVRLAAAKVGSRHPLRSPRPTRSSRRRLSAAVEAFAPEVAVVSEVMSWSIAERLLPEGIPVVYDAANVESELFRSLAEAAHGVDRATFAVDARRVAAGERALLARADVVIAVSDAEADVLGTMAPDTRVEVVPSSVPAPAGEWSAVDAEPVVLFVGTLDYPPNVDAVRELVAEVLPRVRERIDARLQVVGRRPTRLLRGLVAEHDWVELHEDAAELRPYYLRAGCALLPIRAGGGTKLKVYEALSWGLPLVATPEAVAGVRLEPGREALVAADVAELADHAARVLGDAATAAELGRAGRTAFTERLSWERAAQAPLDRLIRRLAGPP